MRSHPSDHLPLKMRTAQARKSVNYRGGHSHSCSSIKQATNQLLMARHGFPNPGLIIPEALPSYCLCASTCPSKEINALMMWAQRILNYIPPYQNTGSKALSAPETIPHRSRTCQGATVTKAACWSAKSLWRGELGLHIHQPLLPAGGPKESRLHVDNHSAAAGLPTKPRPRKSAGLVLVIPSSPPRQARSAPQLAAALRRLWDTAFLPLRGFPVFPEVRTQPPPPTLAQRTYTETTSCSGNILGTKALYKVKFCKTGIFLKMIREQGLVDSTKCFSSKIFSYSTILLLSNTFNNYNWH